MEFSPVNDRLVPGRYSYEVICMNGGCDVVDYGLNISLSSDLVMSVRNCRLVGTVVVLVEESALL